MPSRRLRLGMLVAAAALAATALAVALLSALAAPGLRLRWDWSRHGAASLSARTATALAALPEGSRATAFLLTRGEDPRLLLNGSAVYARAYARLRALLEDARVRSRGRLHVLILDDTSSLVEIEQQVQRLGRQPGETVVLETPEQRQVLRFSDLFLTTDPDLDSGAPARIREERVDDAFGDAALRLARAEVPRVGIVQGPLEPHVRAALQALAQFLRAEGYEPVLVDGPSSSEPLDLLLIPGQPQPFRPEDAAAVRAWLQSGRPLLVAVGPLAPPPVTALWNELLAGQGVRFGDGLVCEGQAGQSTSATFYVEPQRLSSQHPVTRELAAAGRGLVLSNCRPLEIVPGNYASIREPLARTSDQAWVEADGDFRPGSREPQQEVALALAAEPLAPDAAAGQGRCLVLGAPTLLFEGVAYHPDFLARALHWLLREEDVEAGLVALEALPFRPSPQALARIHNLAVVALPGTTLLLGFLVYWRRRR